MLRLQAEKLAEAALATEPAAALKALALLCLGRVAHARGQLRQAFLRYQQVSLHSGCLPGLHNLCGIFMLRAGCSWRHLDTDIGIFGFVCSKAGTSC